MALRHAEKMLLIPEGKYSRIMEKMNTQQQLKHSENVEQGELTHSYSNNSFENDECNVPSRSPTQNTELERCIPPKQSPPQPKKVLESEYDNEGINSVNTIGKLEGNDREITKNVIPATVNTNSNRLDLANPFELNNEGRERKAYVLRNDLYRSFPRYKWLKF